MLGVVNRASELSAYRGQSVFTFKQFLLEGGKATEKLGTERANQKDMKKAIAFVSKQTGIPVDTLVDRLLGSARLTYHGMQEDSGDIDVAVNDKEVDRKSIVDKLEFATGNKATVIGGSTYSFAVPVSKDKKVQLDLMFVPDTAWAKFSYHASEHSAHKSGVRNELLHSALKFSMEDGKDLRLKDIGGNDIVRASRSYKLDQGVERIFKVAPLRKDGSGGRVKSVVKSSAKGVQAALDQLGHKGKFDPSPDIIRDPDTFAKLLFGPTVKAKDLMSAEQLIKLIKKHKPDQQAEIFRDAVKGIKRLKFQVPDELKKYE